MLNQAKSIICLLGLFILRFTLAQTAQTAHITAPPDPASVGVVPGPLFSTDDQGHTNFDFATLLCIDGSVFMTSSSFSLAVVTVTHPRHVLQQRSWTARYTWRKAEWVPLVIQSSKTP
ncbi:hypothetical protein B0T09DRAFT_328589 [Sordaria sp. MPI-SDFR-AT-0083]|nr:hypothetical protein B0T09DRAFT_328589 [Sordaria sp. MPI-SDFR-AT-0083]